MKNRLLMLKTRMLKQNVLKISIYIKVNLVACVRFKTEPLKPFTRKTEFLNFVFCKKVTGGFMDISYRELAENCQNSTGFKIENLLQCYSGRSLKFTILNRT